MRAFGKFALGAAGLAAVLALSPTTADASVLTITDTYGGTNTVWTLTVQTGCTTCAITLQADFEDPSGVANNIYAGQYIDSVQWKIDGADPTAVGFLSTTALDAAATSWTFAQDTSLNANQCGGGGTDAVCGQTNNVLGFGPIVNGSTLQWTFNTTFAAPLPASLTGGNIRAAFNTKNGSRIQNFNIFSPGGGTFTNGGGGSTGGGGQTVPEPGSLALFGLAALGFAKRIRR
jgi:uncharacterized membrane protein YgcG